MRIAFFGSSLVSSYWNGAATYYRGLLGALAALGHDITFYEPDAYERQQHRDIPDPPWARVVVYPPTPKALSAALADARGADVVVKASGVGVFDDELLDAVAHDDWDGALRLFWDVDAPATLAALDRDGAHPLGRALGRLDAVLTYGGGEVCAARYRAHGARRCVPIYNALDPATHFPAAPDARFVASLAFLGNRLPDREARVEEFFFEPARRLPAHQFLLAGAGWADVHLPANVRYLGHVGTAEHNAFNATPLAVLNVARASMAEVGFSPATRVFEAIGAGACLVSDWWPGIDTFFEPDTEVLVARDGADVAAHLRRLTPARARAIGARARARVLAAHTYQGRAREVDGLLHRWRAERFSSRGRVALCTS
jgi:spore maturation protein CgeB